MTKNEFLSRLNSELERKRVPDAGEIAGEYEQHFAFKLADGFSEEEIALKLGDPAALAAQFETHAETRASGGRKIVTGIGLCFADIFSGLFFIALCAWEAVMAALAAACAVLAGCLIMGMNVASLIPFLPYPCAALFGVSFAGLTVLAAAGCVYFIAYIRQLFRAYGRFHHNAFASASGKASLPSLALYPQFSAKGKGRLRSAALVSLAVFAAFFISGMIASMITAGAPGFWHVWNWFVQ